MPIVMPSFTRSSTASSSTMRFWRYGFCVGSLMVLISYCAI
jgi:hypothetical protein